MMSASILLFLALSILFSVISATFTASSTTVPVVEVPPQAYSSGATYTPAQLYEYIAKGTQDQQQLAAAALSQLDTATLLSAAKHSEPIVRYHAVNSI